MVDVQIRPRFEREVDAESVRRAACAALRHETERAATDADDQAALTIVITDDAEIQALNRQFRGIDAPTDVLSFGALEADPSDVPFVVAGPAPPYLGDVVLSFERTVAQATEQGGSIEQELRLLVVHGVLHLLGHDHDTPQKEAQMWDEQATILAALREADNA